MNALRHGFERLDPAYLDDLVSRAMTGDPDAFAELFVAVSDRQLCYLEYLLGDRETACEALKAAFVKALQGLHTLSDPGLFMPWICRLSASVCLEAEEPDPEDRTLLARLLALPLAESQILIMSAVQGLSEKEICSILNVGKSTVRRFLRIGRRHLGESAAEAGPARMREAGSGKPAEIRPDALSPVETAELLRAVFEACGQERNSVPVSALYSYTIYRKERFSLQRRILAALLVIFALLPALFITPDYTVSSVDRGERGLPVYTIHVRTLLPVRRVTAAVKAHRLPVYEAGAREYTVEPTRNGTLSIRVELVNRQGADATAEVGTVDHAGPRLTASETNEDTFLLRVTDDGIGVDYREIYAVGASGKRYRPIRADEEGGVLFEYPSEAWDVYIPDHIGNTLHLSVKLR